MLVKRCEVCVCFGTLELVMTLLMFLVVKYSWQNLWSIIVVHFKGASLYFALFASLGWLLWLIASRGFALVQLLCCTSDRSTKLACADAAVRQRSPWLFGAEKFHLYRLPFWWFVLRCRSLWYIIFFDRDLLFQWWQLLLWWLNLVVRKDTYVFVFTPYTTWAVVAHSILQALIKWSESLCAFLSGSFFRHLIVAQPKTTLRWFCILKLPRHILAIIWSIHYSVMGRA